MNLTEATHKISILLVEDTPSERLFIASILQKVQLDGCTMALHQAADGEEAIAICQTQAIDLVVSDWRMPNLSGIALCKRLKAEIYTPYILLLTGNNETEDLVYALQSGADDYLAKPFDPRVLIIRVIAALRLIKTQKIMQAQHKALNDSHKQTKKLLAEKKAELKQAAQLQHSLLPAKRFTLQQWQVNHYFQAASELAGDVFQCFKINEQWMGFFLIDVSGHGAGAAMQSFTLAQALNPNRADWRTSPELLMEYINRVFFDPSDQGQFATMIIGKMNCNTGEYELCNAGHPQPLLISENNCDSINMQSSLPIGIDENTQYVNWQGRLNANQQLMIFSDGIYEMNNPTHGMFGLQRLKTLCSLKQIISGDAMMHHIRHALSDWKQGDGQDDMSIMLFSNNTHSPTITQPHNTTQLQNTAKDPSNNLLTQITPSPLSVA
ncbi:PP2C family protein-serine/threonine phosphatase [Shewanella glacialimarina]|uniref:PP2C family protein-serine/threonine phosphatase n=1 Tax=Shewanella glacialimarina TaxID=2590884 RepID=UPI001CF86DC4|nr:SpoIIE family protein phosphatase [Shewanella glacialimarina]UCX04153.1 fused response regulator/phosphatase [Shewanella glacialimarina]